VAPFIGAIISGLCFAYSLPPFNVEWLMWFGIAPMLVGAVGRRPLEAVGLGVVASTTAALAQVGIAHSRTFSFFAYYPFILSMLVFGAMALGSSLARRRVQGLAWCGFMACLGVVCEWITTFMPVPINVAISQYKQIDMIQIASVTGIWGVSFLIWFTNAALADVVLTRLEESNPFVRRRLIPRAVGATGVLWVAVIGFGAVALHGHAAEPKIRVAAIQDCTGDETQGLVASTGTNPAMAPVDRDQMTKDAAARGAKLAVWSEECLGSSYMPLSKRDETTALVRKLGVYMVVGYSNDAPHRKTYNCAGLIAPNGRLIGVHHKICLFAEEVHTIEPGNVTTAFATPLGRLGMEICFDTCNTSITRRVASHGARLILVPNYDPPTVHGILHNLHAALVVYRAVENHVPLVRCDSNGDSQVIDPYGRILAQAPLYAPATIVADVPLGNGRGTVFTRQGDWFAYLCVGWAALSLVWALLSLPARPPCVADGASRNG